MPPVETTAQLEALPDALVLAATGGILDAIVFLYHGHVFANTMTGNFIFLGIAFLSHNWNQIVLHLAPIAAFFAGVTTSKHLRNRLGGRSILFGLNLEIAAVFALGWLPSSFPDIAFTAIIAYVAAIQVASIRHVERFAYNSTFMTGNLRVVAEGLYDTLTSTASPEIREIDRAQTRDLGLICLCFLGGAILGAWAVPRYGNHSLWLAEPLLLTAAIRTFRHPKTPPESPSAELRQ